LNKTFEILQDIILTVLIPGLVTILAMMKTTMTNVILMVVIVVETMLITTFAMSANALGTVKTLHKEQQTTPVLAY
jgi:hypothetical protein